jgi:hypothetical protein
MTRIVRMLTCGLGLALVAGCSHYEGSRFNYQSGGLPFGGLTFAIGRDKNADDIQIRRADGSTNSYATVEDEPLLQRIPNAIKRLRAPDALDIPANSERSLTDDYELAIDEL